MIEHDELDVIAAGKPIRTFGKGIKHRGKRLDCHQLILRTPVYGASIQMALVLPYLHLQGLFNSGPVHFRDPMLGDLDLGGQPGMMSGFRRIEVSQVDRFRVE